MLNCFTVHSTLNTANIQKELIFFPVNIKSLIMGPEEPYPSPVFGTNFFVTSDI